MMNRMVVQEMYEVGKRLGKDVRINRDKSALLFKNFGDFTDVFKKWGEDRDKEFVKDIFMRLRSVKFFDYVIVM